jgi:hypothetical protein
MIRLERCNCAARANNINGNRQETRPEKPTQKIKLEKHAAVKGRGAALRQLGDLRSTSGTFLQRKYSEDDANGGDEVKNMNCKLPHMVISDNAANIELNREWAPELGTQWARRASSTSSAAAQTEENIVNLASTRTNTTNKHKRMLCATRHSITAYRSLPAMYWCPCRLPRRTSSPQPPQLPCTPGAALRWSRLSTLHSHPASHASCT